MVSCSTTEYPIEVTVTTHFEATGQQIIVTYDNNGDVLRSNPIDINGKIANTTIRVNNIDNGNHYISASFLNAPDCLTDAEGGYNAPRVAQIKDFSVNVSESSR